MKLHEQYTTEVHEQLNYVATWLPTVKVALGDVCTMYDHQLQVVSSLADFKIPFATENAPVDTDIEYSSEGAVSIRLKASGDPPPLGSALTVQEAGITLAFNRANAVVMRMSACKASRIKGLHEVGQQILSLKNEWPKGYVVISQVVKAGTTTIIISKGSDAVIDLVAKAGIGAGALTLASLDAGLQIKNESKIGAKFIAQPGLTPLAYASGVKRRFLGDDVFRGADTPDDAEEFRSVGYEDFVAVPS